MSQTAYDSLSYKQSQFVDHYIATGNASEAVRRAGYTSKHPDIRGVQILKSKNIRSAIAERQAYYADNINNVTIDQAIDQLWRIGRLSESDAAKVSAIQTIARIKGWIVDRKEITGKVEHVHESLGSRSVQELNTIIERIESQETKALPSDTIEGEFTSQGEYSQPE